MHKSKLIILAVLLSVLTLASCAELRQSRPILPIREYERMIVGRLDAEYVGTDNCVARCHRHDKLTDDFRRSVHGEQIKPGVGLPLVNCESCHGPGSLAIAGLDNDPESNDRLNKRCDFITFLDIMKLPPPGPVPDLSEMPFGGVHSHAQPLERQRPRLERRELF